MGPEVGAARGGGGHALGHAMRGRLRQRHRRPAAAAQGAGPQAGRRGHHHAVHLLRDRGRHPQRRRATGVRGHRARSPSTSCPTADRGGDHAAHPGHHRRCTCSARWRRWSGSCPSPQRHGLAVIEDAAQSIGARRKVDGDLADGGRAGHGAARSRSSPARTSAAGATAGMIVTQDDALADRLRRLRLHGGAGQYYPRRGRHQQPARHAAGGGAAGQAAVPGRLERRRRRGTPRRTPRRSPAWPASAPPVTDPANEHIFHQYTIRVDRRDELLAHLKARGHRLRGLLPAAAAPAALLRATWGTGAGSLPVSEAAAARGAVAADLSRADRRAAGRRSSTRSARSTPEDDAMITRSRI